MAALKQITPPGQFKPEGIGEPVIGVRIFVPTKEPLPCYYPRDNRIATKLLCGLLEARMELAGVHVTESSEGLEFNWSFYMFTVSELEPGLKAIKDELAKLGLLGLAQIGWYDPREDIFRSWHSKSGRFDAPSDPEFEINKRHLAALCNLAKKLKQEEYGSSGQ
jgi:hypothetical protein